MIVFLDPRGDVGMCFFQAAVFGRPDFPFLHAAMEPFDVAIALGMMIRRAAVRDAEPLQRFEEARRGELRAIAPREWGCSCRRAG